MHVRRGKIEEGRTSHQDVLELRIPPGNLSHAPHLSIELALRYSNMNSQYCITHLAVVLVKVRDSSSQHSAANVHESLVRSQRKACTLGLEVCRYLRPLAIWMIHSSACSWE